jgi:two-component system CheB/CheR fusion protein
METEEESKSGAARCPIVGIGASAGGLEALRALFARMPANSGLGFVVIQHLDPDRPSMLTSVLSGVTRLPVVEITDGMPVKPNRVHVIPGGSDLTVREGILQLLPRKRTTELHLPIDSFLRSLAADQHGSSIGVVLSGSGADGTQGLRAIKAEGGIGLAQSPDSAQFRSMPESALAAGVVDFCSDPEEIAKELVRLASHPYLAKAAAPESGTPDDGRTIATILATVREKTGVDFSAYKRTTVRRRIERRMAVRHLDTLGHYAAALRDDPAEARLLSEDMLIHVTAFFRDEEAFESLSRNVFEPMIRDKDDGASIRIWVPGCSTGEEVYAIGICLAESLQDSGRTFTVKLFGSDLSDEAIETARAGVYRESDLAEVQPARLARFFERVEGGYRVTKQLRDLCVFVKHDLTRDAPFAKLDLISCRNVLIYFDTELQRRVIPMLHYCLNKPGYLFLGESEAITGFRDLFVPLDKDHRIFAKTGESPRFAYPLPAGRGVEVMVRPGGGTERGPPVREVLRQADHLLLARFAPPGVIVNERLEIIQYRGHTGAFLEPPPGQPEANVLRMARHDLVAHLHEAVERAKAESATVRREKVRIATESGSRLVDLEVIPLAVGEKARERYFLILFETEATRPAAAPTPVLLAEPPAPEADESRRLKAELLATKDYLQSLIDEHQRTNDDLAAANEELIASNEELQSTNEELQSAKEELQSANEELSTLNDELSNRNEDLDKVANDLVNVLASVEIPIIIVDMAMKVRRFTPRVADIAAFIPADVGRPIADLQLKVKVDDLDKKIREVIAGLVPREWDIQSKDGRWLRLNVRPYRTSDNRLDGAVLSFIDVDILKHALRDAEIARDFITGVVEALGTPLVVLEPALKVVLANHAFYERYRLSRDVVEGRSFYQADGGSWDVPAVRAALSRPAGETLQFGSVEMTAEFPHLGRRVVSLTARPIRMETGEDMTLLAISDVTELRRLEAQQAQLLRSESNARAEAERANRAKDLFLATLSHELRTPLSSTLMQAQILRNAKTQDPKVERVIAAIERSVRTQARLINDLLDVSRIASGKLVLDLNTVDPSDIVQNAVDVARASATAKSVALEATLDKAVGTVYGDTVRLQQVLTNLLTNAIKFTPPGGRVTLRLERADGHALITVTDTGMGIRPEVLPHLFERFVQADSSVTRTYGGLGLGLAIVRHIVEAHGGTVDCSSAGEGKGATFRVSLPLGSGPRSEIAGGRTSTASIQGIRVLVVEDEEDARDAFSIVLGQFGADVRAAPSAAAGLAIIEEWKPQVILCDIAMAGEDGYSFIRKLRKLAPNQGGGIPAAALTALASERDREEALAAGFQMHLAKPADGAALAATVATLAQWKRGESASEQRLAGPN